MRIIFLTVLALSTVNTYADCDQYPESVKESLDMATTAVLAEVVSAQEIVKYEYAGTYRTIEQFKGEPHQTGLVSYSLEAHSILLTPGKRYVFFFNEKSNYVSICSGDFDIGGKLEDLNKLRKLVGHKTHNQLHQWTP